MVKLEVLVIEDNRADAEMIRILLEETGICHVRFVTNGEEAISLLKKEGEFSSAPRPDLIMLDLQMPRMNGEEFLARADDLVRGIEIVVISGYAKEAIGEMPYKLLIKPGTAQEIDQAAAIVKRIVEELVCQRSLMAAR